MRRTTAIGAAAAAMFCCACLDPLESEAPGADGGQADGVDHVEDVAAFADLTVSFPGALPYRRGFLGGEPVWFWEIPPPVQALIPPAFFVRSAEGLIGPPVIDVVPGEPGYAPWWRVVDVEVTERYQGEPIRSREALDRALADGLVTEPTQTEQVITAPVVLRATEVELGAGETARPVDIFYRDHRVSWVRFRADVFLPVDRRRLDLAPFYTLQRIDEPHLLDEGRADFDIDGDGRLVSTNNIFSVGPRDEDYTPWWGEVRVRTSSVYVSIEDGLPEIREEAEIARAADSSPPLVLSEQDSGVRRACPLQLESGGL